MIRSVRIRGFKSILDQTMDLGRVNCLIGANGAGKSNLLEALGVLGAAAGGRVDDEAILRRGIRAGLPRLYKTSFASARIPPAIMLDAMADPDASFHVSLLNPLYKPEPAWSFKTESLFEAQEALVSRGVRTERVNLAPTAGLSALKFVELASGTPASLLLEALQSYAIYCPNTPALRAIVPDPQMRPPVGLSGGGLAEAFAALQKSEPEQLLEDVFDLIEWVSDIGSSDSAGALLSPAVPRSKQVLKFTDRFKSPARNTLTAYDASEGALYVLFAAVLCLSESAPRIFAIDNLDQALNPRLVARLVSRLPGWLRYRDVDTDTAHQMLFTAHNPAVLDGLDLLDPDVRLFAIERNSDGHTCARRIELSAKLKELHRQYPLSRLWLMGNLGAVPNV